MGSCQAHSIRYKFSKSLIFTWQLEFLSSSDRLISFFFGKYLPNIQDWGNHCLYVILSRKKWYTLKKKKNLIWLTPQTIKQVFFLKSREFQISFHSNIHGTIYIKFWHKEKSWLRNCVIANLSFRHKCSR